MKLIFILPVFLFAILFAQDDAQLAGMCGCTKKIVGDKTYILSGLITNDEAKKCFVNDEFDESAFDYCKCPLPCTYTLEGDNDKKFCFKPGQKESKCLIGSNLIPNFSETSPGPGGITTSTESSGSLMTTWGAGGSGGLYALL